MLGGWIGVVLAGCISGSFTVPARNLRVMPWNGAWLIYVTVAKLIVPVVLAVLLAAPIFSAVWPRHPGLLAVVLCAGLSFGCGAFLFGTCVDRIGVAVSNAIVNGVVALAGSLSPLLMGATQLSQRELWLLLLGLLMLSAGIAASCIASVLRDSARQQDSAGGQSGALGGVLLALLAGCFSSMLNAGFVYGKPLMDFAVEEGVEPAYSSLAVWVPILGGGFVVNAIATNMRLRRKSEYGQMARAPLGEWLRSAAMGVLWVSAILIYGYCSQILGSTGTSYGWAIIVGAAILTAILWGIWLGEWTGASPQAKAWLYASLLLILVSLFVLSTREA